MCRVAMTVAVMYVPDNAGLSISDANQQSETILQATYFA